MSEQQTQTPSLNTSTIASPIEIAKAVHLIVEILKTNKENFDKHEVTWHSTDTSVIVNLKDQTLISVNMGAAKKRVHSDVAAHLGQPADFEFETFEEAQVRFFQELPVALKDYFANKGAFDKN